MGLDTVELIVNIEKRFRIDIPNNEAAELVLVQEICDSVWIKVKDRNEMTREEVDLVVRFLISEQTGLEMHEILPHHSITSDLGLD